MTRHKALGEWSRLAGLEPLAWNVHCDPERAVEGHALQHPGEARPRRAARSRRHGFRAVLAVALWVVGSGLGLAAITRYSLAPGEAPEPPSTWPADLALPTDPERATLVMAVHPRCPCSRASLDELAKLLAHVGDRVSAQVVFVVPPGAEQRGEESELWSRVGAIPGVGRVLDRGPIAERLRVATSGHTLLYGRDGALLFSGGITAARGHAGDNGGSEAIASLLLRGDAADRRNPVFGCALLGPASTTDDRSRRVESTINEHAGTSAPIRDPDKDA